MTIWCKEYLQASAHVLYKDRGSDPLEIRIPQDSSNKAGFLIAAMTPSHTGLYQCAYYTTEDKLSHWSDPLLLVVTGKGDGMGSRSQAEGIQCDLRGLHPSQNTPGAQG